LLPKPPFERPETWPRWIELGPVDSIGNYFRRVRESGVGLNLVAMQRPGDAAFLGSIVVAHRRTVKEPEYSIRRVLVDPVASGVFRHGLCRRSCRYCEPARRPRDAAGQHGEPARRQDVIEWEGHPALLVWYVHIIEIT
jgi:hypothetical protein